MELEDFRESFKLIDSLIMSLNKRKTEDKITGFQKMTLGF